MRLGFYTNYSEGIAEFAHEIGCTSLELSAWPTSSLNADTVTDDRIAEIRKDLDGKNIQISALGYYPNYLLPDKAYADEAKRYFGKLSFRADTGMHAEQFKIVNVENNEELASVGA